MLAALVAGQRNPKVVAQLARRTMRKKITVLEEAFTGYVTGHALAGPDAHPGPARSPATSPPTRIEEQAAPFTAAACKQATIPRPRQLLPGPGPGQRRRAAGKTDTLLAPGVGLVATIRRDGTPRLGPVEPFVKDGDLWLSMLWHSTKAAYLLRDPRILVHSVVTGRDGGEGEFKIRGSARAEHDPDVQLRHADAVTADLRWRPTPGRFGPFRARRGTRRAARPRRRAPGRVRQFDTAEDARGAPLRSQP